MAKIKEFSFKNVRSYGNKMTTIPFNMDSGLVLIQGKNGYGKTSICEALEYAIYGRSSRVKSKNLPNWFNDNMFTSVKFTTDDNRNVTLSRGLSPDFFQLNIENGKSIDSKDKKSDNVSTKPRLDKLVEDELWGIPFDIFSNNILLSIEDFKSFINMQVSDKRKIIDKIFDTDIFNDMMKKLKEDLKSFKEKRDTLNTTISVKEENYSSTLKRIEDVKATIDDSKEEVIDKLKQIISDVEKEITNLSAQKESLNAQLKQCNDSIQNLLIEAKNTESTINNEYSNIISGIEQKYNDIYNKSCIESDNTFNNKKEEKTNILNENLSKVISVNDRIKNTTDVLDTKISSLTEEMNKKINSITQNKISTENALNEKIEDKKKQIQESFDLSQKSLTDELNSIIENENSVSNSLKTQQDELKNKNIDFAVLNNKMKLYENHKCPQCGVDLEHTEFHIQQKNELKNKISILSNEISSLKSKCDDLLSEFNKLDKEKLDTQQKLNELSINKIDKLNELSNLKSNKLKELSDLLFKKKEELNNYYGPEIAKYVEQKNSIISKANSEYNNEVYSLNVEFEKEIVSLQNTCNTEKNNSLILMNKNIKLEKDKVQIECNNKISVLNNSINEKKNELLKTQTTVQENFNNISTQIDNKISDKNDKLIELAKIEVGDNRKLLSELVSIADKTESELNDLKSELEKINSNLEIMESTEFIIGDNGLKKMIMRKILPSFNQTINEMTTLFDFKYRFIFDDNFDAHLSLCGKEVPISTSRGEGKIMDIIILLSTLQLILMKHSSINMLFLDEIFSNLDVENIARAVGILKDYARKYNLTIFVMSHTTVPQEMFDQTIEVTSDGMFSELKIIK